MNRTALRWSTEDAWGPNRMRTEMSPGPLVRLHGIGFLVLILATPGCSEESSNKESLVMAPAGSVAPATPPAAAEVAALPGQAIAADAVPPAMPRKIIYTADVTLVVESIAKTGDKLAELIKSSGGYLSNTDIQSYTQQRQTATWKVRIPAERFDAFLAAVGKLGELQQNRVNSDDVSQEYYDLEARIANKQREESRLQKHLADSTGKLEDILAVERELSRVRGEIEQMQGRLRFLASQTAMSTVTISATEVRDFVPPASPAFTTQIGRTFAQSVAHLVEFGKWLVLAVVSLAPWIPLIVVALLILRVLISRAGRR